MKEVIYSTVTPLLLGYGSVSKKTAWRLFACYRLISTVLDQKRSLGSFFSLFSVFRRLPPSANDDFLLMSLEKLADENSDTICLLVPCEKSYADFVERNRSRLEVRFILRSPQNACNIKPTKQR